MAAPKWNDLEAKKLHALALQCLKQHNHLHDCTEEIVLDNCGACALAGRNAKDGPNYISWARIYVEARKPIPKKWKQAFERECFSEMQSYASALRKSIQTFGYPKFV